MKENTVVTIGDMNYLWGIFMLIASMRQNGMDEPVLVGGLNFTDEAIRLLQQFPDVRVAVLRPTAQSLTCRKPEVMLLADPDARYLTWVDSDGFFIGNCSHRLIPHQPHHIHVRRRAPAENPLAFRGFTAPGEDGTAIPKAILDTWRRDVRGLDTPRYAQSCSACLLSVHAADRPFLHQWQQQMLSVLPHDNVGVVDRRLKAYHQLDESVLNSLLNFWPDAPIVTDTFQLDKDRSQLFVHFIGSPKPWVGWTPASIRHFDAYTAVAERAAQDGLTLPGGSLPYALRHDSKRIWHLIQHPYSLACKLRNRWRKLKRRLLP